jgi:tetratricopeptide (TPR) repeat protein
VERLGIGGYGAQQCRKLFRRAQAFRRALLLAEGASAGERRLVGIYDALASAYANAGQYAEFEHEYQRALALTEKNQGRQSLDYALLVAGVAVLPTQMGNRDRVLELLREAIAANGRSGSARDLAIVRGCLGADPAGCEEIR